MEVDKLNGMGRITKMQINHKMIVNIWKFK